MIVFEFVLYYQALILLCFNENAILTIEQVGAITGLNKDELKLQVSICINQDILVCLK